MEPQFKRLLVAFLFCNISCDKVGKVNGDGAENQRKAEEKSEISQEAPKTFPESPQAAPPSEDVPKVATTPQIDVDTTPPAAFSIAAIGTPSRNQTPTISWEAATDAISYDLVIASSSNCGNPVQNFNGLTMTSQALAKLPDGTYYACVTASDAANNKRTATNNGNPFVVDTTPPSIVLGPRRIAGNSFTLRPNVTDGTSLTFAWSSVSGPGTVTFGSSLAKDTLISATSEGDYRLRLTVTDQVGLTATSEVVLTWDRTKLLSASRHHTCAIKAGGQLMCWGRNNSGEVGVGNGMMQTSPQPVKFAADRSVLSVAVGAFHTCAILDDASVRCWGIATSHGYTDSNLRLTPSAEPIDLGAGRSALSLEAGNDHSCAILDNGSVKCWGVNSKGQLGYGDTTNRSAQEATAVNLGNGRTAIELALGPSYSCVRLDDGTVKCWGENASGQLGYGDTTNRLAPDLNPITLPGGLTAKHIKPARFHACAILSDDTIACWGLNSSGQMGDRTLTSPRMSPVLVSSFSGIPKRLALGPSHSCALRVDGSVSCWGISPTTNGAGRPSAVTDCTDGISATATACNAVGGTFSSHTRDCSSGVSTGPTACVASGGSWGNCSDFTKVSQGSCAGTWDPAKFAYCSNGAGTQTATAYCTATGGVIAADGYCSDASYLNRAACLGASKTWHLGRIPGPSLDFGTGRSVLAIESGRAENIWSCAVLDNLSLKCWGINDFGNLGYGDSNHSLGFSAVDLGSGQTVQNVVLGALHTCALTSSGAVKCWGNNTNGRLGTGNFNSTPTPSTVTLANTAAGLASLDAHSCALLTDGAIQCWGSNGSGRLGNGILSTVETSSPVSVAGLGSSAAEVAAGFDFTCARLVSGDVKCWGNFSSGQLGTGISSVATACSDGTSTASPACTGAGGTWNTDLFQDCSNGLSTSQASCEAVTNGVWAHCSDGKQPTSALCTTAAKVWSTTLYNYCTDTTKTTTATAVTATAFCTSKGGTFGTYGYCSDSTYKSRSACLGGSKNWHVNTLPGASVNLGGASATQIVAGKDSACALLQGGSVRCWGLNTNGQIGVGNSVVTDKYLVPAAAVDFGGRSVKRLRAAYNNYCAILDDDSIRCWGYSLYGQLGYLTTGTTFATAPDSVSLNLGVGRSVLNMATDVTISCVITDDNTLRCFGGVIPLSSKIDINSKLPSQLLTPLDLGTAAAPTSLALGSGALCIRFADGSLRCGGYQLNGQPGQGMPTQRWLPPVNSVIDL